MQAIAATGAAAAHVLRQTQRDIRRHDGRFADAVHVRHDIGLGEIAQAEAALHGTRVVDPVRAPCDPRLVARLGPEVCLRERLLPWRRLGGCTLVLSARPEEFARHQPRLERLFGPVRLAVARQDRLIEALLRRAAPALVERAESRTAASESCRTWRPRRAAALTALTALAAAGAAALAPGALLLGTVALATLLVLLTTLLKLAAFAASCRPAADEPSVMPMSLPVVTLLVPLLREREIAGHLVHRLERLDYPRDLLDVCLVLEADDTTTRDTLARTSLPRWMRTITVPRGTLRTKPRALNYALDFARGSIIGVYDAEDAPAPDQVAKVVARFARRGPEVACLQGALDFYNVRTNWLTRCFALDYAAWFRSVLPGLSRLGLVVPLGGTTLFFRRHALEALGGWDAHNVTEDADLGLRLARHGYRVELIDSVTEEEANGRALPWVRQRSRWLKGYAMTYAVHMRAPLTLWRQLGAARFLSVQVLFLGTVAQFVLAPVLWSLWALALGVGHPVAAMVPPALALLIGGLFVASEAVNLLIAVVSARRAGKGWLAPWAPTLMLYFPLATLAVYKALAEMAVRPFYWDKTAHGVLTDPAPPAAARAGPTPRPPRRARRASAA
ncbi:Glycosyl transferase, family 2 [Oceanicola granulosus HTCC2516]|uniref:Glycosyl transferase, family 2 n=1 Tax=Oceanicola granulosus (strain ATCC BAA-861 / DSM 15982 / KCTC 12143 / HTCC2516) TaxID=314256 RepID=Q2CBG5_OCEGH|nr:Glycosyl transferase, family 2 [Oceanicola granulosus HTCC2516]